MIFSRVGGCFGLLTLGLLAGCSSEDAGGAESETAAGVWAISSPAFAAEGVLPLENTCDGREFALGVNPQIDWTQGPAGTMSYALVLKHLAISDGDPTSPDYFKGFMWAVWDIPANVTSIPADTGRNPMLAGIPGAQQWAIRHQFGYFAPCPNPDPAADPTTLIQDRYGFTLYALPTATITLPPKEADVSNYTLTLTKMLDTVAIGKVQLNAVSSAVGGIAPGPVDAALLVYPAGTTSP